MSAIFSSGKPHMIDYTPSAAVAAGDVLQLGSGTQARAMVAHSDIPANELGALSTPCGSANYLITTDGATAWAEGEAVNVTIATGVATKTPAADGTIVAFGFAAKAIAEEAVQVEAVHIAFA